LTPDQGKVTIPSMGFGLGYTEIGIILVIALIVIGPRKLPEVLRTIGKVMGQLRRTSDELRNELLFSDEIRDIKDSITDVKDSMNPLKAPPKPPKLKTKKASELNDEDEKNAGGKDTLPITSGEPPKDAGPDPSWEAGNEKDGDAGKATLPIPTRTPDENPETPSDPSWEEKEKDSGKDG
jgi:Tat protein translocase TatB subunit